jgi:hypothetical protein
MSVAVLLTALFCCTPPAPRRLPDRTETPPLAYSPGPTPTKLPVRIMLLNPINVLRTYSSLENARRRLDEMVVTTGPGETMTGRQIIEWLLLTRGYDPTAANDVKEQVFAPFDSFTFPHVGARIFLVNVATGLWAEAYGLCRWSLAHYSVEEVDSLFVENNSTVRDPDPALDRGALPADMPNVEHHWHPMPSLVVEGAHYKQFNLAHRLAQSAASQEEAAALVVVWLQQNLFHSHYSPPYAWDVYLDGREPRDDGGPVAYPASIDRIYDERVSGCHEATVILEGMLHSLNIPAARLMVHGHGVLYLPTLDRYVHGDHVVLKTDAPPGALLLTADEFRPFAEDSGQIYAILYKSRYQSPFRSMPIYREGDHLYIYVGGLRQGFGGPCVEIMDDEWMRISRQLSVFQLHWDTERCELTSSLVRIQTLDELTDPQ